MLTDRQKALLSEKSKVAETHSRKKRSTASMIEGSMVRTWPDGVVPYSYSATLGKYVKSSLTL